MFGRFAAGKELPMRKLFTSESVTEGHPDKMCDQISDAVLDAILEKDPDAHVACETCATTGLIMVMGEVTGGVHGGNRVGGNALIDCQVFGIIAGENAAAFAK